MRLSALLCIFGHQYTKWLRSKPTGRYERLCKRCGKMESDPARTPYVRRKNRVANAADTLPPGV